MTETRLVESVRDQDDLMPFGATGDSYLTNIPFQVEFHFRVKIDYTNTDEMKLIVFD